jgi:hypothetical protein
MFCGSSANLFGSNLKGAYAGSNRSTNPCVSYSYNSIATTSLARVCYFCAAGTAAANKNTLYLDDFRVPVTNDMKVTGITVWATATTSTDRWDAGASSTT